MKTKRFLGLGLSAVAALILSAASGASSAKRFPFRLYQKLANTKAAPQEAENLIFSPYSVSQAFQLADLGARGATRAEIQREIDVNTRIAPPSGGDNAPALAIANKIWLEKTTHVEPGYLEALKKEADATPGYADFASNSEGARNKINSWVSAKTHDKIQNLIPPGALSARTRLILANAIYFKGAWQTPFKKQLTIDESFRLAGGAIAKVPFMRERDRFDFTQDKSAQVIELPYLGREFAMIIVLPKKGVSLSKLEGALSPEILNRWEDAMRYVDVELSLPRFKFSSDFVLNHPLQSLGVRLPFESARADFSGIDGAHDLYISNVFHKAFISVDEAGTEAAAATAIELRMKAIMRAAKPVVMNIDHPFVFAIQDLRSKAILFLGRVTHPKE